MVTFGTDKPEAQAVESTVPVVPEQIEAAQRVTIGDEGDAFVLGFDECLESRTGGLKSLDNWLPARNCVVVDGRNAVPVRLVWSNGAVVDEVWTAEKSAVDVVTLNRPSGTAVIDLRDSGGQARF